MITPRYLLARGASTTPYGESKMIGEQLVRAHPSKPYEWMIVRPTSIWGPWFHVPYRNFFDALRRGHYIHPKGRHIRKSFGFVGNSVHELISLMQGPANLVHEQTFYLADYEPVEVRSWGELIRKEFSAPPIRDVPYAVLQALAQGALVVVRVQVVDQVRVNEEVREKRLVHVVVKSLKSSYHKYQLVTHRVRHQCLRASL